MEVSENKNISDMSLRSVILVEEAGSKRISNMSRLSCSYISGGNIKKTFQICHYDQLYWKGTCQTHFRYVIVISYIGGESGKIHFRYVIVISYIGGESGKYISDMSL